MDSLDYHKLLTKSHIMRVHFTRVGIFSGIYKMFKSLYTYYKY